MLTKERLWELRNGIGEKDLTSFQFGRLSMVEQILEEYGNDWISIEEFKANPVDGNYHAMFGAYNLILFYRDRAFWSSQTENRLLVYQDGITHVMLIKTPSAPK